MEWTSQTPTRFRTSLVSWVLGFLGITALIKLLPRTIKYAVRRWVFGLITELVVVIIAGLLTEKLVDRMAARNGMASPRHRTEASELST